MHLLKVKQQVGEADIENFHSIILLLIDAYVAQLTEGSRSAATLMVSMSSLRAQKQKQQKHNRYFSICKGQGTWTICVFHIYNSFI